MLLQLELAAGRAGFVRAGPLTCASEKMDFSQQGVWGGALQAERMTQGGDDGVPPAAWSPVGWGPCLWLRRQVGPDCERLGGRLHVGGLEESDLGLKPGPWRSTPNPPATAPSAQLGFLLSPPHPQAFCWALTWGQCGTLA